MVNTPSYAAQVLPGRDLRPVAVRIAGRHQLGHQRAGAPRCSASGLSSIAGASTVTTELGNLIATLCTHLGVQQHGPRAGGDRRRLRRRLRQRRHVDLLSIRDYEEVPICASKQEVWDCTSRSCHQDHPRPRTRRAIHRAELHDRRRHRGRVRRCSAMLAAPRTARATLAAGHPGAAEPLQHHDRRGPHSVHLLRPLGRRQHRGFQRAGRRPRRPAGFPERRRLQQARPAGHDGAEFERHGQFRRCELRPALPLGQRPPARHEDAGERQGHGGHQRLDHSGLVAERHRRESAQSDVRHLPVRRARRIAQPDRLRGVRVGRQLDGASDHGDRERPADQDFETARTPRAW